MKEIIGNLLKKENVRQNLSSLRQEIKDENALAEALKPVSYTHLDVYKRQLISNIELVKEQTKSMIESTQSVDLSGKTQNSAETLKSVNITFQSIR